jgi:hypothetical protein
MRANTRITRPADRYIDVCTFERVELRAAHELASQSHLRSTVELARSGGTKGSANALWS